MSRDTDGTILALLKDPKTKDKGFTLFMDTYKERIYWFIRRLVVSHEDAEDVLQETFINVYRFADSFKAESGVYTWLYKIATRECIAHFRKQKKKEFIVDKLTREIEDNLIPNETVDENIIIRKFQKAVLRLPEKQKIVFNMRYYNELSYDEMSIVLNTSVNALKTNYHYATEKIKKYINNF